MRILVGVKRVIDYSVKIRCLPDKTAVDYTMKKSMNPFCEIAVEEAVRLKEKGIVKEIIALTIGNKDAPETLRQAVAFGCDRSIFVQTDMRPDQELQPLAVAKVFKHFVEKENPDIVMLGKQAIDDDANQTGQLLAGLLDWPQATFASELEVMDGGKEMVVTREIDGGLQTIRLPLPAVVTADLRLNQPRYPPLPALMKAKKKKMDQYNLAELGIDVEPRLKYLSVEDPPVRQGGAKVESVDDLVQKLQSEAKVL
mmetsp:Transcript_25503/g.82170  ORF Transcript_25503/g.82170 Transcript_25503/m.82170 type:complete len:255 (+) Transcript_25503:50-814(+)